MRAIKFRAWIKSGFDEDFEPFMAEVDQIVLTGWDTGIRAADCDWDFKDVELMQFTGLTDKNGKEIYEGDIVSEGEGCWRGKIEFDEKFLTWGCSALKNFSGTISILACSRASVIGNIYENPELLKTIV